MLVCFDRTHCDEPIGECRSGLIRDRIDFPFSTFCFVWEQTKLRESEKSRNLLLFCKNFGDGKGGWDLFALILNQTNYERNYEGNVNTAMALLIKMVMVIKGFWQQLAFPPAYYYCLMASLLSCLVRGIKLMVMVVTKTLYTLYNEDEKCWIFSGYAGAAYQSIYKFQASKLTRQCEASDLVRPSETSLRNVNRRLRMIPVFPKEISVGKRLGRSM